MPCDTTGSGAVGRGLQPEDAVVVFARSCGSVCNKPTPHTFFPRVQSADHEARWRRTAQRANAAVRPAAPYTTDILREAWCVRLLSLRSFTWDWWRDRQNRAPVHRQKSARISKSRPHPTHVALATLVRQPTAYPPLHSAPSTLLGWQDIVGVITFRAVFALSWNVRRV